MQALIDFEGWHKWKELSSKQNKAKKVTTSKFGHKTSTSGNKKDKLALEGGKAIETVG